MREVEFFAQVHPLIHGGRHSELRAPGTRDALIALRDGGIISGDVAADLDAAYVLFRTIEHRLQMVEDQQTHNLPKSAEGLALRSEEHTSELQSLMRISYAVFCLKKKTQHTSVKTKYPHGNNG